MTRRRVWAILAVAGLFLAPLVWDAAAGGLLYLAGIRSMMVLFALDKAAFAAVLLALLYATGAWRRCGFAGGVKLAWWWRLWPLWLATATAALQIEFGALELSDLGWLGVAAAVAVGEEGIFRGAIPALLDPARPTRAVLISAALFGAAHLAGLATDIDWRMIAAQAAAAAGLGVTLGAVRLLARSIWPGLAVHAAMDCAALLASGGVGEALAYSPSNVAFILGIGLLSLTWGLVLCRRIEPPSEEGLGSL